MTLSLELFSKSWEKKIVESPLQGQQPKMSTKHPEPPPIQTCNKKTHNKHNTQSKRQTHTYAARRPTHRHKQRHRHRHRHTQSGTRSHVSMQVSRNAGMQSRGHTGRQACRYVGGQARTHAGKQAQPLASPGKHTCSRRHACTFANTFAHARD